MLVLLVLLVFAVVLVFLVGVPGLDSPGIRRRRCRLWCRGPRCLAQRGGCRAGSGAGQRNPGS